MLCLVAVSPEEPAVRGRRISLQLRIGKLVLHRVRGQDMGRPCQRPFPHCSARQGPQHLAMSLNDAKVAAVVQELPTGAEALVQVEVQRDILIAHQITTWYP